MLICLSQKKVLDTENKLLGRKQLRIIDLAIDITFRPLLLVFIAGYDHK